MSCFVKEKPRSGLTMNQAVKQIKNSPAKDATDIVVDYLEAKRSDRPDKGLKYFTDKGVALVNGLLDSPSRNKCASDGYFKFEKQFDEKSRSEVARAYLQPAPPNPYAPLDRALNKVMAGQ